MTAMEKALRECVGLTSFTNDDVASLLAIHTLTLDALRDALAKAREEVAAAERARDEAVKAYRRAADALGWAREIGADEVAQYAALAPEETALDDTGREEFRAGVLAAANYLVSISVPGHISAQFILDLAAGIRALPTPVVEDDECGFCLRPMRERNTKCLLCSPPAPSVEEGPRPESLKCRVCGHPSNFHLSGLGECMEGSGADDPQDECMCPAFVHPSTFTPAPSPEAPARCPECEGKGIIETDTFRGYITSKCRRCGGRGTKGGGK